jgi:stage V sporulation protein AF
MSKDQQPEEQTERVRISKKINENKAVIGKMLGIGETFDVVLREMNFADKNFAIIYVNGFASEQQISPVLKHLAHLERTNLVPNTIKKLLETDVFHLQVNTVTNIEELCEKVLAGQIAFVVDGEDEALVVDAKEYPTRQPEEPDTEKVVRGSRDGFVETLLMNTALTRRRIRDGRLRMEIMQIGLRSKTDICLAYIADVADDNLVKEIKKQIKAIDIDGLPMADKSLEEFITHRMRWNPFPLVRYTERPDVAAEHLLEGHILVYVDTSPSVMILPTTFFHHVQHAEEYRQTAVVGAFLRWVRFAGMLISVFLLPVWFLYVYDKHLLPDALSLIGPKDEGVIPIFWQFMIAELGIDLLRMAAVHTPTPLATAMGLIAAVMIGQVAIDVGLFSSEVILYVSIATIGLYSTPSYELSLANGLVRLFLLVMVAIFKIPGFVVGTTFVILVLALTKSMGVPYLWPLIPFNFKAFMTILVRTPVPYKNKRPSIVRPKDETRQPSGK